MDLDPVILSRLQFAWVIGWHILMPAFTVGMASYIAILEGFHFVTGKEVYLRTSMFWIRVFSVAFGVGVVSGVIMPFQFGTNWSRFADATSNVLGPLFAYEGLTAFFLEAAFLGVLLFGRKLVPPWAHFVAAIMVASGTLFSSFWILAANSWMQTPAGYETVDGRFFPREWLDVIFNPSFPYRLGHTVVGFYVTTGFVVVGVAAYLLRKGRSVEEARVMLSMTLWLLTRAGPAADPPRRPARPQHARAPAGQARRHRGALGYRPRRSAHFVRPARCRPMKPIASPSTCRTWAA